MKQGLQDLPQGAIQRETDLSAGTPPIDPQWAILDALPVHVAVLDSEGVIVHVNAAWRLFGNENQCGGTDYGVGQNYLDTCACATGEDAAEAPAAADGIRAVLRGELPEFSLEYPCHSPLDACWFRLVVTPRGAARAAGVLVTHVNITGPTRDATALRHAEKVAQESGQRLDFALSSADVGDWSLDLRTNDARRSLRHDQCFGYQELLPSWTYETLLAHIQPVDRERVNASFQRALSGQGEYDEEFRTMWPDGSVHWLWTRGRFYFDNAGTPYHVAGIVMDISPRKRAEIDMARVVERLTEAQRIGRIGDWEWDIATDKITWSPEVFEIFGRDPLLGPPRSATEVGASLDAPSRLIQQEVMAAATGSGATKRECELVVVRPNGDHAHVLAHTLPRSNDRGDVVGLYGTVQDITERKRAELVSVHLASIVASSDHAIFGENLQGTVTSWNRGAERLFGYTDGEMVGASITRIFPADRIAEHDYITARISSGASVEHLDTIRCRKDGRSIEVSVTASPIRDGAGAVIGISNVVRDVSERKKLEQQMMRAQRMESIGTLAGGIAHDLNNVLSPIMLSLELLRESVPDEESHELIATLDQSARHGADMVRQLLQFARGVDGQRLSVDIGEIVHEIERLVRDTFLKHIEVATVMPSAPWRVLGDRTQLHQVLLNLCVNARDAMPAGGLLAIRVENVVLDEHFATINPDANEGPHVHLSIADNGSGIDPSVMEQIFDPFFTTKEFGKGTGLGLSTTMAIVRSHGGFLRVYSEPGRGTTFHVYLPSHAGEVASSAHPVVELPRGRGELILVIEDEPSVRLITTRTLEAFGYRVIVAANGAEGVATYAPLADQIAVVLTDMMMPVMNGPDAIRRLQTINPAIRVVATSGLDASAQLTDLGVRHFLSKPYATNQLLAAVQQAIVGP